MDKNKDVYDILNELRKSKGMEEYSMPKPDPEKEEKKSFAKEYHTLGMKAIDNTKIKVENVEINKDSKDFIDSFFGQSSTSGENKYETPVITIDTLAEQINSEKPELKPELATKKEPEVIAEPSPEPEPVVIPEPVIIPEPEPVVAPEPEIDVTIPVEDEEEIALEDLKLKQEQMAQEFELNIPEEIFIPNLDDEQQEKDVENEIADYPEKIEESIIDEFTSESDKESFEVEFKKDKMGYFIKMIVVGSLFAVNLLIVLLQDSSLLPSLFSSSVEPITYVFTSILLLTAGVITCIGTVVNGFTSLFSFKRSLDTVAAISSIAILAFACVAMANLDTVSSGAAQVFTASGLLILLVSTVGKYYFASDLLKKFQFITENDSKNTLSFSKEEELCEILQQQLGYEVNQFAVQKKTDFTDNFMKRAYSATPMDRSSTILTIISVVTAAVVTWMSVSAGSTVSVALSHCAAVLSVSAPLTLIMGYAVPLYSAGNKLKRYGAVLNGYSSVEDICKSDALVCRDVDIIAKDSITIHGIKTFADARIDEIIIYCASVMDRADNPINANFDDIIQGKKEMLLPTESLTFSLAKGIEAYVNKKRVNIGTGKQLEAAGFDVPSKDYEDKYVGTSGRAAMYVAISGELLAMFTVSYHLREQTLDAVYSVNHKDISVMISTTDPLLDERIIGQMFGSKDIGVTVIESDISVAVDQSAEIVDSAAIHSGSFESLASLIKAAFGIRRKTLGVLVMQWLATVGGIFMVMSTIVLSAYSASVGADSAVLYQLGWSAIIWIIAMFF